MLGPGGLDLLGLDVRCGRERRVHHDDRGLHTGWQGRVEVFGVLPRVGPQFQRFEHLSPAIGQLVGVDLGAGDGAEHGQTTQTRRRFDVDLAFGDVRQPVDRSGVLRRCRELLAALGL